MAIYLQLLQRYISGPFLVKRAAHQLEVELGYLQRKKSLILMKQIIVQMPY